MTPVDQTRGGRIDLTKRWVFCSGDYAAGELCTLAQVCINMGIASRAMADAINAGQDLHTRLAARFLGIGYAEALQRYKEKDPILVNLRQSAKPVNFGKPGLMGPPKMVATARKDGVYFCELAGRSKKDECWKQPRTVTYTTPKGYSYAISPTCEACLELAEGYSEAWYAEWPEMEDYHAITVRNAKACKEGVPIESFGSGMLRLDDNPNAVSNHYFQNLLAQAAKRAFRLLQKESYTDRRSVLFNNLRVVLFVHDENLAEIRESVMHEAAVRMCKIMVDGAKPLVPDVQMTCEPALMRRWFKGVDATFDHAGKLKPWWPTDKACWDAKTRTGTLPAHAKADCGCWKWPADQTQMLMDLAA